MGNVLSVIGNLCLGASVIISVLGSLVFVLKGIFSRDSSVRAACFGAAKGAGLGFLVFLLLLPFIFTIGLGFQANVSFNSAMSFISLTMLSLIITLALMIRGYSDAT
jgi:hypothetical protein